MSPEQEKEIKEKFYHELTIRDSNSLILMNASPTKVFEWIKSNCINVQEEKDKQMSVAFAEWCMGNIYEDTNCRPTDELYDIFMEKVYIPTK